MTLPAVPATDSHTSKRSEPHSPAATATQIGIKKTIVRDGIVTHATTMMLRAILATVVGFLVEVRLPHFTVIVYDTGMRKVACCSRFHNWRNRLSASAP